jgi:ABC-type bacteriocin/lantibiotic exporter with double-glycine peptidase domain
MRTMHPQLGVSAFAGVAVLVFLMPINAWVGRAQASFTRKTMEARDKRIKLVNEVLTGVRIVKMFGWEHSYMNRIRKLRDIEMSFVRTNSLYGAFSSFLWCKFLFCFTCKMKIVNFLPSDNLINDYLN